MSRYQEELNAEFRHRIEDIEHLLYSQWADSGVWSEGNDLWRRFRERIKSSIAPEPQQGKQPIFTDRNGTPCYEGDTLCNCMGHFLILTRAWTPSGQADIHGWVLWIRKGQP